MVTTRNHAIPRALGAFLLALFCLSATDSWARLPKPTEVSGVLLTIDHETQTLVFQSAKEKKPFLLDWNKETEFIKDGRRSTTATLKNGVAVVIHYKELSFRNPLLKRVIWNERVNGP